MPDRSKPAQPPKTLRAFVNGVLRVFTLVPKKRISKRNYPKKKITLT